MALMWLCISLFFVLMFSGSRAVYVKVRGTTLRRLNINETTTLEWKFRADDRQTDVNSGHLLFKHGITILTDYNLDTRTSSNVSMDDSDPNLQFYSPAVGVYGYRIARVRVKDAGKYDVTYREYNGMPGQTADSITVFVYAPPTKPIVAPQTPIMKGHDVRFQCLTESQSEPVDLRPEMVITWTKNGIRISDSRYSPDGDTLTIHGLDDREQRAKIECHAHENGSAVSETSEVFEIILITIQDIELSDNDEVVEGSRITLSWKIYGLVEPPPEYNHSLVFYSGDKRLGEYYLRYRHWTSDGSIDDRSTFYTPRAAEYGFILYNVKEEDIGMYTCIYEDEFGTSVRSNGLKLKLKGHTFPTILSTSPTTPLVITAPHVDKQTGTGKEEESNKAEAKPGSTSSSTQNKDDNLTLVVGSAVGAGFGCLFLLLVILIPVILCHRRNKDLKNLIRAASNNANAAGGTLGGTSCSSPSTEEDRYSIYNVVRESMMVPENVVITAPAPNLPDRDTTYNQAFEDTRCATTKPDTLRQFSSPHGCSSTMPNQDRGPVQRKVDNKRRMVRSLSSGHVNVEENEYLTPINLKAADVRYVNTEPVPSTSTSDQKQNGCGPQAECGYLEMGKDGAPSKKSQGNAYITMDKEHGKKMQEGMKALEDSSEYINIVKAENSSDA